MVQHIGDSKITGDFVKIKVNIGIRSPEIIEQMVEEKGEYVAMPQARAQAMHYMKGLKGAASLRKVCCELSHLEDLDRLIEAVFDCQRRAADPDDVRELPFP